MADPGWHYWEKISDDVKRILRLAESIANDAKINNVTAAHIMLALIRTFPNEVKRVIQNIPLTDVTNELKNKLIYTDTLTKKDQIIKDALFIANFGIVKLTHIIRISAGYCGLNLESTGTDTAVYIKRETIEKPDSTLFKKFIKEKQKPDPFLNKFGRDLTQSAITGKLHPIIGRNTEINLVAETLCRVIKRNPLLVGPAGVGKTAIVEGLTQKLESDNITPELQGVRIIEINVGNLIRGTKYRGEFENRLMQIIEKVRNTDFILFIDELHTLFGAGLAEGTTLDATSMLLPYLARGEIACIGATTDFNYHKIIEQDKAFERRFQPIRIAPLTPESTLDMLKKFCPYEFEKNKKIKIDEDVYYASIDLAERYMKNRHFPDKALDIIDQAVGRALRKGNNKVTVSEIRDVIGSLTGIPVGKLEDELKNKLNGLTSHLKEKIKGQDHVADIVADTIWPKTLGVDLRPERPNGVFLFIGPTGVGKTEFARVLAEHVFGSQDKLIRIDMSEFKEPQAVAKLLGAPFGYQGHEKGSPILNEIKEKPFSILLLDEIEKAHPDIHKLFLQVFDTGVLTDTNRDHVYFSDVIIIMTSNILVEKDQSIGFLSEEKSKHTRDKLTTYFPPEFLNRIDYICVFNKLSKKVAEDIVNNKIIPLIKDKWKEKNISFEISPDVLSFIVEKGFSEKWGARNLERTVDTLISSPLAKFLQDVNEKKKTKVKIFTEKGTIQFKK